VDHDAYRTGIGELYAAEVLGEGLASRWLELSSNPDQKYKLSLFLQLESAAKARLRPLLALGRTNGEVYGCSRRIGYPCRTA
jgi:hypothetical protein